MRTKSNTAREQILGKIKSDRENRAPFAYPEPDWDTNIYKEIEGEPEDCFVAELAAIDGNCILCHSEEEIYGNIKKILHGKGISELYCKAAAIAEKLQEYDIPFNNDAEKFYDMEAGVTCCEALVARTGSVLVSSAGESGRQMNIYPPVHFVIAQKTQIVPYVSDALKVIKERYAELPSTITNITGPSRTADIEKTLVLGAHGPKEIWVLLDVTK